VEDERPWLAGAAAYVIPLRSGGGMRFKVVQAMASGVPVITTRFGASGVAATDEQVTFAETAGDFAAGISSVLEDRAAAERKVAAARDLAVGRYDWRRIVPALDAIYGSPVEGLAR
jgi:glycosyltransferase involved in cell wall biosynthesis